VQLVPTKVKLRHSARGNQESRQEVDSIARHIRIRILKGGAWGHLLGVVVRLLNFDFLSFIWRVRGPPAQANKESSHQLTKPAVGVEKVCQQKRRRLLPCPCRVSLFVVRLSGDGQNRCGRLAEEAHESLDVLGCRGQEELLPHELQSPQTQAAQADLILEFREPRFYFLSLPLYLRELGRVRQVPCPLPGGFIHVDGKKAERSAGALGF
jgi:hypothetical protein